MLTFQHQLFFIFINISKQEKNNSKNTEQPLSFTKFTIKYASFDEKTILEKYETRLQNQQIYKNLIYETNGGNKKMNIP